MNKHWHECLFPLFLSTISSCTYASFTDEELMQELDNLAVRAIARFRFPRVDLAFEKDDNGYYFINDVTFREIDIIICWMKVLWIEYQLSKEQNYQNLYADKDVKAFSSGNLIASIEKAFNTMMMHARKAEEFYYRSKDNKPTLGELNDD